MEFMRATSSVMTCPRSFPREPLDPRDTDFDSDPNAWLGFRFGRGTQPDAGLVGLPLEYQVLQLYTQGGGSRACTLATGLRAIPGARRCRM